MQRAHSAQEVSNERQWALKAIILGISTLLFAYRFIDASAEGAVNKVRVIKVRVDTSGKGIVFFDGTIGGTPPESPSCVSAAYTNAPAFDTNTAGGKSVLALVLSAKATDTVLSVYMWKIGTTTFNQCREGNHDFVAN